MYYYLPVRVSRSRLMYFYKSLAGFIVSKTGWQSDRTGWSDENGRLQESKTDQGGFHEQSRIKWRRLAFSPQRTSCQRWYLPISFSQQGDGEKAVKGRRSQVWNKDMVCGILTYVFCFLVSKALMFYLSPLLLSRSNP